MNSSRNTILLIDDDADDAAMTLYSLKKLNLFNFSHIDDGGDALKFLFDSNNPDPFVILLDLRMPRVDGIEILSKLKADQVKKHIPVIALISSKDGISYVESFHLKADGYLMKPVTCHALLTSLGGLPLSNSDMVFRPSKDQTIS